MPSRFILGGPLKIAARQLGVRYPTALADPRIIGIAYATNYLIAMDHVRPPQTHLASDYEDRTAPATRPSRCISTQRYA